MIYFDCIFWAKKIKKVINKWKVLRISNTNKISTKNIDTNVHGDHTQSYVLVLTNLSSNIKTYISDMFVATSWMLHEYMYIRKGLRGYT